MKPRNREAPALSYWCPSSHHTLSCHLRGSAVWETSGDTKHLWKGSRISKKDGDIWVSSCAREKGNHFGSPSRKWAWGLEKRGQTQKRKCPQEFSRVRDWASPSIWSFLPELLSPASGAQWASASPSWLAGQRWEVASTCCQGCSMGSVFLPSWAIIPAAFSHRCPWWDVTGDYSALSLHWAQNRLLWVGPETWPYHVNVGKSILSDRHRGADPFLESRLYASWNLSVLLEKENYSLSK